MNLSVHIVFTAPVAAGFYGVTRSWAGVFGVFITGVLIDVTHFLEFWHDRGLSFNIKKFFQYCNSGVNTRHYIVLHSYELLVLLFFLTKVSSMPYFFWGLIVGVIFHLILDYVNIITRFRYKWYSFLLYSFLFRMSFGFRRDRIDAILRHKSS